MSDEAVFGAWQEIFKADSWCIQDIWVNDTKPGEAVPLDDEGWGYQIRRCLRCGLVQARRAYRVEHPWWEA